MDILVYLLHTINKYFEKVEKNIIIITSFTLTSITLVAVINRYFLKYTMAWYEEVAIILYMVLVYWGASNVARRDDHLRLNILSDLLRGEKIKNYLALLVEIVCFVVSLMATFYAIKMSSVTMMKSVTLSIPNSLVLICSLTLGFLGLTLTYLYRTIKLLTKIQKTERNKN